MKNSAESVVQLLSPYGNWEHKKGMQVVDKDAAKKIRNAFMQGFDRIWGVPIYVGHPDEGKNGHKAKTVGKVESVSVTPDGIAISARYSEEAYGKLSSGKLKWLSPRWRMEKLDDGTYRPVKLISVGMTNNPNIPGSGALLKSGNREFQNLSRKISTADEGCAAARKRVGETRRAANAVKAESDRLKGEFIDKKIRETSSKPAPHELAKMALERADQTGETYLESFTALRRKYYGKTKFGAQKRSANQRKKENEKND